MSALPEILTAAESDPQELAFFLQAAYPPPKSAFLNQYGAWQHGSNHFRYVLKAGGKILGYSALIPTWVHLGGEVHPAHWWVDLVIAPEARGRGYQSIMDAFIREQSNLLLGFPNEVAAGIHRKHGWGVRDDMLVMLLPLQPARVKSVLRSSRAWVKWGAQALTPLAAAWRQALRARRVKSAWKLEEVDSAALAEISRKAQPQEMTSTLRDEAFFKWRYKQAPHAGEFAFYLAGAPNSPQGYLIARHMTNAAGLPHTRVLDMFGDFQNPSMLDDLLTLAAQDAMRRGSTQITLLASLPDVAQAARRAGFVFSTPMRFCWLSRSSQFMRAFSGKNYWTLADSDNDEVE